MAGPRKNPQDLRLPKYVYLKKGRYVYVKYLGRGKLGPEIVLAPAGTPLRGVWEAYEHLDQTPQLQKGTLSWLCGQYLASTRFAELHQNTKTDYLLRYQHIAAQKTDAGKTFGEVEVNSISPANWSSTWTAEARMLQSGPIESWPSCRSSFLGPTRATSLSSTPQRAFDAFPNTHVPDTSRIGSTKWYTSKP